MKKTFQNVLIFASFAKVLFGRKGKKWQALTIPVENSKWTLPEEKKRKIQSFLLLVTLPSLQLHSVMFSEYVKEFQYMSYFLSIS